MTLTRRSLLWQAILLPLVVYVIAIALNEFALWREVGPQDATFWLFVFLVGETALALTLALRATKIGASPWPTMAIAAAAAAVSMFVIGPLLPPIFGESEITVGDRGPGPGGGFSESIGSRFNKADLDSALASANRLNAAHAFDQFTCGDPAPDFRFELTLRPQGEYNERYVSVGYTPNVDVVHDRCLSFGLSYLVDSVFFPIDTGPRVKYGYVNPETGKPLPDEEHTMPRKPVCRCDLRDSGGEWVMFSPEAAAALGADSARDRP